MPSHNWSSDESAVCRRCGARRDWYTGITGERFRYSLPDGLGSLDTRPACGKGSESRRTRKMGRRAKVLARHRAGGPRLLSKEAHVRRERAEYAAVSHFQPVLPSGDSGPTSGPSGEPDAS